ncbi:MAG: YqgE/AlgH family protein [Acidobacteriota bacterium]|nr:YqgE/AlgH family protein [Acidobacteriota bacterium]
MSGAGGSVTRDSLAPGLVIAMPQLADPNFQRAVVLLLRSNDEGAFGLVINRPSDLSLKELCQDQDLAYNGPDRLHLMIGGPVEIDSHLLVLHGDEPVFDELSESEILVAPGVYLVTAREGLERLAERGTGRLRCFAGYAGWGPGQLEDEVVDGAWVLLPSDARLLFDDEPAIVWEKALRQAGIDPIALVPGGAPS